MKCINHQNVINFYEVFETPKSLMIVLEYAGGGDILNLLKLKKRFTENEARSIFNQIVMGVQACHNNKIIHRDIKLDNILICSFTKTIKICDFGVSKLVRNNDLI